ncbi:TetR/AcrR family transcriptional regulator [Anaerocolumna xylanovorans]|uniref:Transcriptional regulator, TetR family n=1 Tax=Anaerocolumna xylanovorans DSM 12503 TaxID=1121345 RepID=A0A1M7XY65_9FIRM|nr:TetR/AcrR family transcriptional regulator [Anaerocolumna xylanovorans]SHO43960.1 transcriptional regulator, TetR family [Anaerocolumna xylanovorans DSM 12503]
MNKHKEEHQIVCQSTIEALFSLMEKKAFSEISVTELIQKAGIARTTYYRNFTSKEAVISTYIDDILRNFNAEYPVRNFKDRYQNEHILHILDYVLRYENHLKILYKSGLSAIYLDRINRYFIESYREQKLSEREIFDIYAYTGSEFNVIFNWLMGDSKLNKNEIAELIKRSINWADEKT